MVVWDTHEKCRVRVSSISDSEMSQVGGLDLLGCQKLWLEVVYERLGGPPQEADVPIATMPPPHRLWPEAPQSHGVVLYSGHPKVAQERPAKAKGARTRAP